MNQQYHPKPLSHLTPDYYLNQLEPQLLEQFNPQQIEIIQQLLAQAIPKPSPKIVDLRFTVDLIVSRFYVVLFMGQERRQGTRRYRVTGITKIGNLIAAIIILISLNLFISSFIFLILYLIKSAVGIDLFQGHLIDLLKKF